MTQKFFKGDHVRIGKMPSYMRHFRGECDAIVLYTYAEKYGGDGINAKQYSLYLLPRGGEVSWYDEDQLKLIDSNRFDLLPANNIHRKAWEAKRQRTNNEGLLSAAHNLLQDIKFFIDADEKEKALDSTERLYNITEELYDRLVSSIEEINQLKGESK